MPGLSGLELQSRLIELGSILPIVFVTGHADTPTTVRAIKAGAEDFLTKPASSEQLIAAIERALARYEAHAVNVANSIRFRRSFATLTPRERQVFDLIVRGKINKQIAAELGTTERTVKAHRHEVMEKMQVHSLAELVSSAERLGLLDPDPRRWDMAPTCPSHSRPDRLSRRSRARGNILARSVSSFVNVLLERLYRRALVDGGELGKRKRRRECQQV